MHTPSHFPTHMSTNVIFCLGCTLTKSNNPFRTSNFSTFLFTVLVDGAKPSTNFPREAGREAASKEPRSAVNGHCGQLWLHRVSNAGIAHTSVVPGGFFQTRIIVLHNEFVKGTNDNYQHDKMFSNSENGNSGKRCFDILEVLFH